MKKRVFIKILLLYVFCFGIFLTSTVEIEAFHENQHGGINLSIPCCGDYNWYINSSETPCCGCLDNVVGTILDRELSCTNPVGCWCGCTNLAQGQPCTNVMLAISPTGREFVSEVADATSVAGISEVKQICCCYPAPEGGMATPRCIFSEEEFCPKGTFQERNTKVCTMQAEEEIKLTLQVPFRGLTGKIIDEVGGVDPLGDYIAIVFNWSIGALAILAIVMIMIAGFQWITASGNDQAIASAKKRIKNAILGLLLGASAYTILIVVNPAVFGKGHFLAGIVGRRASVDVHSDCPYVIGSPVSIDDIKSDSNLLIPDENKTKYDDILRAEADKNNIDCDYLKAIMFAETRGNPNLVSEAGACGLMQVLPETARQEGFEYDCNDLKEPQKGVEVAAKYVAGLKNDSRTKGDFNLITAGYNGGIGANDPSVDCPGLLRWQCKWDNPEHTRPNTGYDETRDYVRKTQGYLNMIIEEGISCNSGGPDRSNICFEGGSGIPLSSTQFDRSRWNYADSYTLGDVSQQIEHMSPELARYLNCMRSELDKMGLENETYTITSISDKRIAPRGAGDSSWNFPNTKTFAQCLSGDCGHGRNSCHYGGPNCTGKSYAVDFRISSGKKPLENLKLAAQRCYTLGIKSKLYYEGSHFHASVGSYAGCGCDVNMTTPFTVKMDK